MEEEAIWNCYDDDFYASIRGVEEEDGLAVAAATALRSLFMTYVHTTDRPARSGVHHSVVSCFTPGAARSQRPA